MWTFLFLTANDHYVHALSQWETTLHCKVVSCWLGANTKWCAVAGNAAWPHTGRRSIYAEIMCIITHAMKPSFWRKSWSFATPEVVKIIASVTVSDQNIRQNDYISVSINNFLSPWMIALIVTRNSWSTTVAPGGHRCWRAATGPLHSKWISGTDVTSHGMTDPV